MGGKAAPAKGGDRGARRKRDFAKALRKMRTDRELRGHSPWYSPWYGNLHQFSKNKIHCGCLMCAFNGRRHGRVVFRQETAQDRRNRGAMDARMAGYLAGEDMAPQGEGKEHK